MDLRNSNGLELRNFYFTTYGSFFRKFSSEVETCIMWSSSQVLPNQVSKNRSIRFNISHSKLHKKPSETLGAD